LGAAIARLTSQQSSCHAGRGLTAPAAAVPRAICITDARSVHDRSASAAPPLPLGKAEETGLSPDNETPGAPRATLPTLTRVEARALGVLIEKAATTPDLYPLTLNAVVVAANQKTSRDPVMELDPGEVGHALRTLEDKGCVAVVHGSRALRYEHRIDEALALTKRQRAVLCMLMLRGAQTQNELFVRCERLADFTGADDVRDTLDRLASRSPPLAVRIPRQSGQREDRYAHLLCGDPEIVESAGASAPALPRGTLEARLEELEARVAALEQALGGVAGS
jgi:uncharacterized protein